MTIALLKYSSIKSFNNNPPTIAGIQPIITFFHSSIVAKNSLRVFLPSNGFNLLKYKITTAKMAPSWMTTLNIS